MSKIQIIGGGPAGMMAAILAAGNGHQVALYEKNEKLGKKLFITGKGRCNVTNGADMDVLMSSVVSNPRFLYSAFYSFTNHQLMEFFENHGVSLKTERGERVFPVSDHSSDIIRALSQKLSRLGVRVYLNTTVEKLIIIDDKYCGLQLDNGKTEFAAAGIVATGGLSYPSTGSTGDGYRFAKEAGMDVTDCFPSLVPMETKEDVKELQGLSLRNISISITEGKKRLYEEFGELLFTHYGVSGPVILSASSFVGKKLASGKALNLSINLKPALTRDQLDHRILRDFEKNQNKQFKNAVDGLFPAKLRPVMIRLSGIQPDKKVNEITKEERLAFVDLIRSFRLTLTGLRDYREAIITKGGVDVREIDPSTMESKKVKDLYFAGEVLDLDALTGGFNLQIAWSTGYLAGTSAGEESGDMQGG